MPDSEAIAVLFLRLKKENRELCSEPLSEVGHVKACLLSAFSRIPLWETRAQARRKHFKEPHFGMCREAGVKVIGSGSLFRGGSWENEDFLSPDVGTAFEN